MSAVVLSLVLALGQAGSQDLFSVRGELQGLYSEISQATLQFETEEDIDQFHAVLYTPDWVYVDASGQPHSWQQTRDDLFRSLKVSPIAWMSQDIEKLSLVPDGAMALVKMETVRTVVDNEGRFGRQGASHTLTEATMFRDAWVNTSDGWKLKSRHKSVNRACRWTNASLECRRNCVRSGRRSGQRVRPAAVLFGCEPASCPVGPSEIDVNPEAASASTR